MSEKKGCLAITLYNFSLLMFIGIGKLSNKVSASKVMARTIQALIF
jgi:hypothetical protein